MKNNIRARVALTDGEIKYKSVASPHTTMETFYYLHQCDFRDIKHLKNL